MIKKRLVGLLAHAKKYIVYQVAWLWIALLCQIVMIYCAAFLLEQALFWEVTPRMALSYGGIVALALALRQAGQGLGPVNPLHGRTGPAAASGPPCRFW